MTNITEPSGETRQPAASIAGWSRASTAVVPPGVSATPKPPRSLPSASYRVIPATPKARLY